jgi:hypothetical protein
VSAGPEPRHLAGRASAHSPAWLRCRLEAAKRADLMRAALMGGRLDLRSKLERGDLDGQALWKRIRRTIVELQAPPIAPLHEPRDRPGEQPVRPSGGRTLVYQAEHPMRLFRLDVPDLLSGVA